VRSYPPLEVHADGVCLGTTPVTVEVVPKALWICVPTPELLVKFSEENSRVGGMLPFENAETPALPQS
jgi:hypothetical protein